MINTTNLEMTDYDNKELLAWKDLIIFQVNVAERWQERSNKETDIYAKFFFTFAGFNALYFLWGKIDGLGETNEGTYIENLLKKFSEPKAQEILDNVPENVDYFIRRGPVRRMDKRNQKKQLQGDSSEGKKHMKALENYDSPAQKRLQALGQILYLVRCNLVHGSKTISGDDTELIETSFEPLRIILIEVIFMIIRQCPWVYNQYFAYGSNLSTVQMKTRCPNSQVIDKGCLKGYRLDFTHRSSGWACGTADIIEDHNHDIWGLVYSINDNDFDNLDEYEGYPNHYDRFLVSIITAESTISNVWVYGVVDRDAYISPSREYLGIIKQAAIEHGFPEEYRSYLDSIKTQ